MTTTCWLCRLCSLRRLFTSATPGGEPSATKCKCCWPLRWTGLVGIVSLSFFAPLFVAWCPSSLSSVCDPAWNEGQVRSQFHKLRTHDAGARASTPRASQGDIDASAPTQSTSEINDMARSGVKADPAWVAVKLGLNAALKRNADALYHDTAIGVGAPADQVKKLLELRKLLEPWEKSEPKVRFSGFYRHRQMFLLPWMLAILGSVALWLLYQDENAAKQNGNGARTVESISSCASVPSGTLSDETRSSCRRASPKPSGTQTSGRWRGIILLALALWITTRSLHLLRAFVWSFHADEERQIYSFVHYDLYKFGFILDVLFFFVMCWILAWLCARWWRRGSAIKAKWTDRHADLRPISPLQSEILKDLTHEFNNWQVASLVLAGAFLHLTIVYWRITTADRDMNYLMSALLAHGLWTFVWLAASRPLWETWRAWQNERLRLIDAAWPRSFHPQALSWDTERHKYALELLREIHPVGLWRLVATVIVAVVSYVAPAIKTLMDLV